MRVKGHIGTKKNKNKEKAWEWEYFNDSLIRRSGGKKKKNAERARKETIYKKSQAETFSAPITLQQTRTEFCIA